MPSESFVREEVEKLLDERVASLVRPDDECFGDLCNEKGQIGFGVQTTRSAAK
jgi:hypothetical protein